MKLLQRNRHWAPLVAAAAATATAMITFPGSAQAATFSLPPTRAAWDYQIGGAYTPPADVQVVSRDWKFSPAAGLYNVCYINAFQTQKEGEVDGPQDWAPDLLAHDATGATVMDPEWNEAVLDISTDDKRQRIAAKIEQRIDSCASKGFNALELDNLDTYFRFPASVTQADAETYLRILSAYGHDKGLAVGQKNTVELAANHAANGVDFAVVEQCGSTNECQRYIDSFGSNILDVEYSDSGLTIACTFDDTISVVQRDMDVTPISDPNYVRKTC